MKRTNSSRRRKRRLKPPEINELLARYPAAGLNQREFAAKEAVPVSTLQYWLRRARNGTAKEELRPLIRKRTTRRPVHSSGPAGFIEVNLEDRIGPATAPICYEVQYGEWKVRIPEGFSRQSLSFLLESIREP